MQTASGKLYPNAGEYIEVIPNSRLVYSDEPDPSIAEWHGDIPGRIQHTVRFDQLDLATLVTLDVTFASAADRRRLVGFGMDKGLEQGLDRLTQLLTRLLPVDP